MSIKLDSEHLVKTYIEGCIKNERNSQKALYQHFYSFAMGICLRYANDKLDASGILNEAFFKVFKNISNYDTNKAFLPWLGRIITNTSIDFYRVNLKFSAHVGLDALDAAEPLSQVNDKLAYEDLLKMIQMLSPAYRTVFNLFAIDGYSHEEIAQMLSISVGTSKSNLFKARQKLQELLKENEEIDLKRKLTDKHEVMQIKLNTNI
ncbi:RNA polymerase sigma factor [Pedobacter sp.]|uniref:RNA polymerase sigma factor n=1 Tax=Pedobacter sp. TaxID=1411316 RepID=UPI003BA91D9D